MDSFIATFHIDWKIMIAQAVNFVIVLAVVYFLALKPLKKLMRERQDTITKGLTDARENATLLTSTKKEYDAILAKARIEAHDIFQDGKVQAQAKRDEMIEEAKKDVEHMITVGKKTLEAEKVKMIEEAKKEIVGLVVKATEKLLEDSDTSTFNKKATEHIRKA
jgi:F-type H+-transporting ATPase subunit b